MNAPEPVTAWHNGNVVAGKDYPTRANARWTAETSDEQFGFSDVQIDYVRATHEAGHAVAALAYRAHLHAAFIVRGHHAEYAAGGRTDCCTLSDENGHAFAAFSGAGERAVDRWLREAGLWTAERSVANEVGASSDRNEFLAINPEVGFGEGQIDYRAVHDISDDVLARNWSAVLRIADRLVQDERLDGETIAAIAGLTNGRPGGSCDA